MDKNNEKYNSIEDKNDKFNLHVLNSYYLTLETKCKSFLQFILEKFYIYIPWEAIECIMKSNEKGLQ